MCEQRDDLYADEWKGLYREKWSSLIVPESVAHP